MSRQIGRYHDVLTSLSDWIAHQDQIIIDEAMQEADQIIILNQDDQLQKGIDANGRKIEPPYRPLTVALKTLKHQPVDRVTLKDEGTFYNKMKVERASKGIYVDSSDKKTEKLVTKYGEDIFGLTEENIGEFSEHYLGPRIQERFRKEMLA